MFAGWRATSGRSQIRPDDVVGRGHHESQVAHDGSVVPKGAERSDLGHGLLGADGAPADVHGTAPNPTTRARVTRRTGVDEPQ